MRNPRNWLVLFGLLDALLLCRYASSISWHEIPTEAPIWFRATEFLRPIFLISLAASAFGLVTQRNWGLVLSYFQFPFRFIYVLLSFGWLTLIPGLASGPYLYRGVLIAAFILEAGRIGVTIWAHRRISSVPLFDMQRLRTGAKLAGYCCSALAIASVAVFFLGVDWLWRLFREAQGVQATLFERFVLLGIDYVTFVAVVKLFYVWKQPLSLPAIRPFFCLMPKYWVVLRLSDDLIHSSNPIDEISALLRSFGFTPLAQSSNRISFTRGSELGDFFVEFTKLRIHLFLPLTSETNMIVEAGGRAFVLYFDNGDLCAFATELTKRISSYRSDANSPPGNETGNP